MPQVAADPMFYINQDILRSFPESSPCYDPQNAFGLPTTDIKTSQLGHPSITNQAPMVRGIGHTHRRGLKGGSNDAL